MKLYGRQASLGSVLVSSLSMGIFNIGRNYGDRSHIYHYVD